jgi:hypothetical protein
MAVVAGRPGAWIGGQRHEHLGEMLDALTTPGPPGLGVSGG